MYDGTSWNDTLRKWFDLFGVAGPAFETRGSGATVLPAFLGGRPVLSGAYTDSLQFDSARVTNNPKYSLFHVARYNDSAVYIPGPFGSCNRMLGKWRGAFISASNSARIVTSHRHFV